MDRNTPERMTPEAALDVLRHSVRRDANPQRVLLAVDTLAALAQRVEELEAKCELTMGVGDGTGQKFVHGDYDSIKTLQAKLVRADALEKERDFLVSEYERAVGCGPQGYLHCAMHLYNAITNANVDAYIAHREKARLAAHAPKGGESG